MAAVTEAIMKLVIEGQRSSCQAAAAVAVCPLAGGLGAQALRAPIGRTSISIDHRPERAPRLAPLCARSTSIELLEDERPPRPTSSRKPSSHSSPVIHRARRPGFISRAEASAKRSWASSDSVGSHSI